MHKKLLRHEIIIHALPTKIWKVLTCSDYSRQFLHNEGLYSDWIKGSPIIQEVEKEGKKEAVHKGTVQEVIPGLSLQFTLYELPEFSDNTAWYRYELVPEDGGVRLVLSQEVLLYSHQLYTLVSDNCQMMLQKIKWLAEYS